MTKEMFLGFFRHLLTFGGGFAVAKGYVDDSTMMEVIAALVTLVGAGWSIFQKKTQAAAVETALKTPV